VKTVRQAQELVACEKLDAAILDINLHGETASDFIERLAATKVPCLIVSGYGEDAVPESINSVPRLEKPINPPVVVGELAAHLGRTS
jgi:DNA-binding response OmpR family regulator